MERKRIEKLVVLLLIGILLPVSLFPFRINADTITTSNIHLNTSLISVNYDRTPYFYNYEYEFVFDKQYVGWVSVNVVSTYYSDNNLTQTQSSFQKAIYVNGGKASITSGFFSNGNYASGCLVSASFSVVNSNVIEYSVINSLDQITDILTDVSNYVSIDVLSELENIVSNTSLANDYLEIITKIRNWNIPFESFPIVFGSLYSDPIYFQNYDYDMKFPIFDLSESVNLGRFYLNSSVVYTFVMMLPITSLGTFNNNFEFYNDRGYTTTITNFVANSRTTLQSFTNGLCLIKFNIQSSNNGFFLLRNKTNMSGNYMPIYWNLSTDKNISTDFALLFGLSNKLLDDLDIIAQGTTQSSSASGSLDQTTSQFSDDANDLVTIEESFNDSMNDSLENVSPVFNMGSSFLTSANWVSQQFNRLVNNTPFASLITFGLTLGLGLLIIGKVRK